MIPFATVFIYLSNWGLNNRILIKLDLIEFNNFNIKSQLYLLAEDGKLISIVRISNTDCTLHLIYDFYMLLVVDLKKNRTIKLNPITIDFWNKTYAVFLIKN